MNTLKKLINKHELKGVRIYKDTFKVQGKILTEYLRINGIDKTIDALPLLVIPNLMEQAIIKHWTLVCVDVAKWQYQSLIELEKKDFADLLAEWIQNIQAFILANSGDEIKGIDDTTLERIRKVLYEAREQKLGTWEIARLIREETGGEIGTMRALRIARTESTSASSFGHLQGAKSFQKETGSKLYKEWVSTEDGRTRRDHVNIDGALVAELETFNVGGEDLEYPGDLKASGKQRINCRCRVIYVSEKVAKRLGLLITND